jgi:DNA ligase 1
MKISKFSGYLKKLDETTKRLEITDILTQLISELKVDETDKAIYLTLGYLRAAFESNKFNIAEKTMIRVLEQAYATTKKPKLREEIIKSYKEKGDLGNVVYELAPEKAIKNPEISDVYQKLYEVALTEGNGSQETKAAKLTAIFKDLDKISAKYITRIVLGTMRLGFTELTIIDALANFLGDKALEEQIEAKYNAHPDIGLISKRIKEKGIKGIHDIKIETGVPILLQKAQRVSGMEEAMERMKVTWAEFKFDGTRVQLHFDKNKKLKHKDAQTALFNDVANKNDFLIRTFTRNLEETTHQYPDLIEAAVKQIKAESVILDGEAIGYSKETGDFLPFQETIQRKRKYGVTDMAKTVPLKYFVFDILFLNGEPLVDKPLRERRKILKSIIKGTPDNTIIMDDSLELATLDELAEYFEIAKEKGLEGLMLKSPDDPYQAGARSYSWIKLKKADEKLLKDSVDVVVLGYYAGKGMRSKFGIGGFLVGVYDKKSDSFKTISKIGTGLKEDDWFKLKSLADKVRIDHKPVNVDMDKMFEPDVFTAPKIIVEIGADEITKSPSHTAGYALRFPRLLKFREDKNPLEATTLDEILKMYVAQKHIALPHEK